MKAKKFSKKLTVNKETIVNLNSLDMYHINGGDSTWSLGGQFTCGDLHTCGDEYGFCKDPFAETEGALCPTASCAC